MCEHLMSWNAKGSREVLVICGESRHLSGKHKGQQGQRFEWNAEEVNFYPVGDEEPLNNFEENERRT